MRGKMVRELKFRRRREGLTNYKKRLALVKSGLERIIVRKTNKRIMGQVVEYSEKGDRIVAAADSNELSKKYNWPSRRNRPTAYLTGLLLARKAKDRGEMILDIGITAPVKGSIPFVFAKGCIDGGIKLRGKFEVSEDSYTPMRIAKYAESLKKDQAALKRQFGGYIEKGVEVESLPKLFNEVKAKILQGS
ncbi:MAG: 50S ribosomal protein L18 [Candidatus Micrarchaeales archaeon]|jgi:large subunit ribosomal protein L18